jgi:hypothetical protein
MTTNLQQGTPNVTARLAGPLIALLVALAALFPPDADAQAYVGNRFGLVVTDVTGDAVSGSDAERYGSPMNLMLGTQITPVIGAQVELNLTARGADDVVPTEGSDVAAALADRPTFLEVPLVVRLQLPVRTGPYAAVLGGAGVAFRTGSGDAFADTEAFALVGAELGLAYGGGRAFVDGRFVAGLTDLLDADAFGDEAPDLRSQGFAVTVGAALPLAGLFGGR